jgi:hypothetical protein
MADSRAVDAAQAAGYSVTDGVVGQALSGGALDRLRRVISGDGGHLEYVDAAVADSKVFYSGVKGKEFTVSEVARTPVNAALDTDSAQGANAAQIFTAAGADAGYGVAPCIKVAFANTASDGHSDVTGSMAISSGVITITIGIKTTVTLASEVATAFNAIPGIDKVATVANKADNDGTGAVATMAAAALTGGVAPSGTAEAAQLPTTLAIELPVDDNQAHAMTVTASGRAVTVTLGVASDGSTVVSTCKDVVDALNADSDSNGLVSAALTGNVHEDKGYVIFEDVAESGDDLIFTGKTNGQAFSVNIREPRGRVELALTAVTVSVENEHQIKIIVPATKTVANVKTAVEAHTEANALVTVTTAGTTSHAVAVTRNGVSAKASFQNRGSVLATAVAVQTLSGGEATARTLQVVPATA